VGLMVRNMMLLSIVTRSTNPEMWGVEWGTPPGWGVRITNGTRLGGAAVVNEHISNDRIQCVIRCNDWLVGVCTISDRITSFHTPQVDLTPNRLV